MQGVYNKVCFSPTFVFHFFVLEKPEWGRVVEVLYVKYKNSHTRGK